MRSRCMPLSIQPARPAAFLEKGWPVAWLYCYSNGNGISAQSGDDCDRFSLEQPHGGLWLNIATGKGNLRPSARLEQPDASALPYVLAMKRCSAYAHALAVGGV
ncbi:conserved hypothetical protein [Ricinus communis]|uniref:Uncharacterized protein n=1 Tax=Ricinus communis TaxID=3988 RepID=B9TFW5_RICCO|nr:conserved hypothetical protein [Ricinus communis]